MDRDEARLFEELEDALKKARRREILERLNAHDSGVTQDERREEATLELGRETERHKALKLGRYGYGSAWMV